MTTLPFEPPLSWLWSCHHCHARYPLGATRRCLHDGHYFCGGTTVSPLTGKPLKRHKACGSEFDYVGWEDFSRWQRRVLDRKLDIAERLKRQNSCEYSCAYPSACHHRSDNPLTAKRSKFDTYNEDRYNGSRTGVNQTPTKNKSKHESFLDPSCLELAPTSQPLDEADKSALANFPTPKSSGSSLLRKMIKTARRSSRDATPTSAPRPTRPASPNPLSSSPSGVFTPSEPVGALASAKELGLVIPPLEISLEQLPSFFSPDSSSSSSSSTFTEEPFPESEATSPDEDDELETSNQPIFSVNNTHHTRSKPKSLHIDLLEPSHHLPDIDMTDTLPDSPTSPTSPASPSPPFPPIFTNPSDAANLGGLLTPKSPDSPTNPFFTGRQRDAGELVGPSPPSPLSPSRRGSAWNWMDDDEVGEMEETELELEMGADTAAAAEREGSVGMGLGLGLGV